MKFYVCGVITYADYGLDGHSSGGAGAIYTSSVATIARMATDAFA